MDGQAQSARRFAALLIALALAFAFVARQYLDRYAIPIPAAVAVYLSFLSLLVLALAPGAEAVRSVIPALFPGRKKFLFILIFLFPYFVYAAGARQFRWLPLLRLVAIAAPAPLLYLTFPVRKPPLFSWQDALLGTWMLAVVLFHRLQGVFTVAVNLHSINLDFMARLFLIAVASWTWTFIRPVHGLGYDFVLSKRVLTAAALNFALFALIAIPTGQAVHFISWNPHWRGPGQFSLDYLEIFLFIALLEELFFRGFLQNLLSRTFRRPWTGQLLASALFGLSHVFHAPAPNWRYVALASIAGWFYGSAYRSSGSILASSLTHALVDTAWRTFFSKI